MSACLVSCDPHYLILVVSLIVYKFPSDWKQLLVPILFLVGAMVGYVYAVSGYEAFKSIYVNLLFIEDGNESMSMVWYFYLV